MNTKHTEYLRQAAINGIAYHINNPQRLYLDILPRAKKNMRSAGSVELCDYLIACCQMNDVLEGTENEKRNHRISVLREIENSESLKTVHSL